MTTEKPAASKAKTKTAATPKAGITIVTGLSGAGRSEAARCLEDLGYFVVDNLPPALINKMGELVEMTGGPALVAFVVDVRGGKFFAQLADALYELDTNKIPHLILFLEASEEALVNRFEATRRKHPLATEDRVIEGIRRAFHLTCKLVHSICRQAPFL